MAHVRHHRSQPWLTARCPPPRELPRGRQGQIPHPCQSLPLAGRENPDPARRLAWRQARPRGRGWFRNPPLPAAWPCPRRPRHRPPHRPRRPAPAAKLATARMLDPATASHSLGETLGLGTVPVREIYATLDWLGSEQSFIENRLAPRHLKEGTLVLYDVTSTYLEGSHCPLAHHGYSRDKRSDRPQLVIGLLCASDGCPVAVEVFEGNTADPATVASQITKLKDRFKLKRVVVVGDRGMITDARIEQGLRPAGLDWITALRAPAIKDLAAAGGPLQPSLFDDRDMAEITSPDFPGERLVVCKNPLLAEERTRK